VTIRLRTLLGDHPGTAALKNGSIRSDPVEFDFVPYSPTNKGFKPMVREAAFDVSEMAIVTYLMAKSFDKPATRFTMRRPESSRRATSTASASASAPSPPRPAPGCAAFSPMTMVLISIRSTG